jgi:hypothetical protein
MKKIEVALQVVGVITMVPLYVILEMNHPAETRKNNTSPVITEKSGKNSIEPFQKNNKKNVVFLFGKAPGASLKRSV